MGDTIMGERNGVRYGQVLREIEDEGDFLDVIAEAGESDINRLAIRWDFLHSSFFDLKSGFAGTVMQKCSNYGVRLYVIMPDGFDDPARIDPKGWFLGGGLKIGTRFRELAWECNKGDIVRFYTEPEFERGLQWLTGK